jgi:hypothetical protein
MFNPFLFRGFEPSYELNLAANVVLAAALELAPEDSITFGHILKDKNIYRGHLEICTSCGIFSAFASSDDPSKVLSKLRARILKQLKNWKRSNFPPIPTVVRPLEAAVA